MADLNKGQQAISERLAQLLAQSLLADDVKQALLDNLDNLPEYAIARLLDALEKEQERMGILASDLEFQGRQKDKEWEQLEASQRKVADQILSEFLTDLEKDAKVAEIKNNLP